jgi:hypothetical protein
VTQPTRELDRLLELRRLLGVPVALAAIPARTTESLASRLKGEPGVRVLVHGLDHSNRATRGLSEFPAACGEGAKRAGRGLAMLQSLFGTDDVTPIFVPPWFKCDLKTEMGLRREGFSAVSKFGLSETQPHVNGLVRLNCHFDPIIWRATPTFAPPESSIRGIAKALRFRRMTPQLADEPFGIVTHFTHRSEARAHVGFCTRDLWSPCRLRKR